MSSSRPRTAAEEELMEAQLDTYQQRHQNDEKDEKPTRRPRKSSNDEAKAGRWVAPTLLFLTVIISAILWLLQR